MIQDALIAYKLALKKSKLYTDEQIKTLIAGFKYMGSVPTYTDLPLSGNQLGHVWTTDDTGHMYVWTKNAPTGTLDDWLDLSKDVIRKLDKMEVGSPYILPYKDTPTADAEKVTITSNTVTLDGNLTTGTTSYELNKASQTAAGVMSRDDKIRLDNLRGSFVCKFTDNGTTISCDKTKADIIAALKDRTDIDGTRVVAEYYAPSTTAPIYFDAYKLDEATSSIYFSLADAKKNMLLSWETNIVLTTSTVMSYEAGENITIDTTTDPNVNKINAAYTYKPMKPAWLTGTTQDAAIAMCADDVVKEGETYFGIATWSDMSTATGLTSSFVRASVLNKTTQEVIFEIDTNTDPYAWHYNSLGTDNAWRPYGVSILVCKFTDDTTTAPVSIKCDMSAEDIIKAIELGKVVFGMYTSGAENRVYRCEKYAGTSTTATELRFTSYYTHKDSATDDIKMSVAELTYNSTSTSAHKWDYAIKDYKYITAETGRTSGCPAADPDNAWKNLTIDGETHPLPVDYIKKTEIVGDKVLKITDLDNVVIEYSPAEVVVVTFSGTDVSALTADKAYDDIAAEIAKSKTVQASYTPAGSTFTIKMDYNGTSGTTMNFSSVVDGKLHKIAFTKGTPDVGVYTVKKLSTVELTNYTDTTNLTSIKVDDDTSIIKSFLPMKATWLTGTTQNAAIAMYADDEVRVGDAFIGTVTWSDLPVEVGGTSLVKAYVLDKPDATSGTIVFDIDSNTARPYAWHYNSTGTDTTKHIWRPYGTEVSGTKDTIQDKWETITIGTDTWDADNVLFCKFTGAVDSISCDRTAVDILKAIESGKKVVATYTADTVNRIYECTKYDGTSTTAITDIRFNSVCVNTDTKVSIVGIKLIDATITPNTWGYTNKEYKYVDAEKTRTAGQPDTDPENAWKNLTIDDTTFDLPVNYIKKAEITADEKVLKLTDQDNRLIEFNPEHVVECNFVNAPAPAPTGTVVCTDMTYAEIVAELTAKKRVFGIYTPAGSTLPLRLECIGEADEKLYFSMVYDSRLNKIVFEKATETGIYTAKYLSTVELISDVKTPENFNILTKIKVEADESNILPFRQMKEAWCSNLISTLEAALILYDSEDVRDYDSFIGEAKWTDLPTGAGTSGLVKAYVLNKYKLGDVWTGTIIFELYSQAIAPYSWYYNSEGNDPTKHVWRASGTDVTGTTVKEGTPEVEIWNTLTIRGEEHYLPHPLLTKDALNLCLTVSKMEGATKNEAKVFPTSPTDPITSQFILGDYNLNYNISRNATTGDAVGTLSWVENMSPIECAFTDDTSATAVAGDVLCDLTYSYLTALLAKGKRIYGSYKPAGYTLNVKFDCLGLDGTDLVFSATYGNAIHKIVLKNTDKGLYTYKLISSVVSTNDESDKYLKKIKVDDKESLVVPVLPIKTNWGAYTLTTALAIATIISDADVREGDLYQGWISWSDLPIELSGGKSWPARITVLKKDPVAPETSPSAVLVEIITDTNSVAWFYNSNEATPEWKYNSDIIYCNFTGTDDTLNCSISAANILKAIKTNKLVVGTYTTDTVNRVYICTKFAEDATGVVTGLTFISAFMPDLKKIDVAELVYSSTSTRPLKWEYHTKEYDPEIIFTAEYGVTAFTDVETAINNKVVFATYAGQLYSLLDKSATEISFARIDYNATTKDQRLKKVTVMSTGATVVDQWKNSDESFLEGAIRYDIDLTAKLVDDDINRAWTNLRLGCKIKTAARHTVLNQTGMGATFADKKFSYLGAISATTSELSVGTSCDCTLTLADSTTVNVTGLITSISGSTFALAVTGGDIERIGIGANYAVIYATNDTTYAGKTLAELKIESDGKAYQKISGNLVDVVAGVEDATGTKWTKISINGTERLIPETALGIDNLNLLNIVLTKNLNNWTTGKVFPVSPNTVGKYALDYDITETGGVMSGELSWIKNTGSVFICDFYEDAPGEIKCHSTYDEIVQAYNEKKAIVGLYKTKYYYLQRVDAINKKLTFSYSINSTKLEALVLDASVAGIETITITTTEDRIYVVTFTGTSTALSCDNLYSAILEAIAEKKKVVGYWKDESVATDIKQYMFEVPYCEIDTVGTNNYIEFVGIIPADPAKNIKATAHRIIVTQGVTTVQATYDNKVIISGTVDAADKNWEDLTIAGITKNIKDKGAVRYDEAQTLITTDINTAWSNLQLGSEIETPPTTPYTILNQTGMTTPFDTEYKWFKYSGTVTTLDTSKLSVGVTCNCTITLEDSTIGPITGTVSSVSGKEFTLTVGTNGISRICASDSYIMIHTEDATTYANKALNALLITSDGRTYKKIKSELVNTVSGVEDTSGTKWSKITIDGTEKLIPTTDVLKDNFNLVNTLMTNSSTGWIKGNVFPTTPEVSGTYHLNYKVDMDEHRSTLHWSPYLGDLLMCKFRIVDEKIKCFTTYNEIISAYIAGKAVIGIFKELYYYLQLVDGTKSKLVFSNTIDSTKLETLTLDASSGTEETVAHNVIEDNIYIVTFTIGVPGITCDKTFSQIAEALSKKKNIVGCMNNETGGRFSYLYFTVTLATVTPAVTTGGNDNSIVFTYVQPADSDSGRAAYARKLIVTLNNSGDTIVNISNKILIAGTVDAANKNWEDLTIDGVKKTIKDKGAIRYDEALTTLTDGNVNQAWSNLRLGCKKEATTPHSVVNQTGMNVPYSAATTEYLYEGTVSLNTTNVVVGEICPCVLTPLGQAAINFDGTVTAVQESLIVMTATTGGITTVKATPSYILVVCDSATYSSLILDSLSVTGGAAIYTKIDDKLRDTVSGISDTANEVWQTITINGKERAIPSSDIDVDTLGLLNGISVSKHGAPDIASAFPTSPTVDGRYFLDYSVDSAGGAQTGTLTWLKNTGTLFMCTFYDDTTVTPAVIKCSSTFDELVLAYNEGNTIVGIYNNDYYYLLNVDTTANLLTFASSTNSRETKILSFIKLPDSTEKITALTSEDKLYTVSFRDGGSALVCDKTFDEIADALRLNKKVIGTFVVQMGAGDDYQCYTFEVPYRKLYGSSTTNKIEFVSIVPENPDRNITVRAYRIVVSLDTTTTPASTRVDYEDRILLSGTVDVADKNWDTLTIDGVTKNIRDKGAIRYDEALTTLTDDNVNQAWENLHLGCKKETATPHSVVNQTGMNVSYDTATEKYSYTGTVTLNTTNVVVGEICSCVLTPQGQAAVNFDGTVTAVHDSLIEMTATTGGITKVNVTPSHIEVVCDSATYSTLILDSLSVTGGASVYTKIDAKLRDTVSGTVNADDDSWNTITINGKERAIPSSVFMCEFTDDTTVTPIVIRCSASYAEFVKAYTDKKVVVGIYKNEYYYLSTVDTTVKKLLFTSTTNSFATKILVLINNAAGNDDISFTISDDKLFPVLFMGESTALTCKKTFEEIANALMYGKKVVGMWNISTADESKCYTFEVPYGEIYTAGTNSFIDFVGIIPADTAKNTPATAHRIVVSLDTTTTPESTKVEYNNQVIISGTIDAGNANWEDLTIAGVTKNIKDKGAIRYDEALTALTDDNVNQAWENLRLGCKKGTTTAEQIFARTGKTISYNTASNGFVYSGIIPVPTSSLAIGDVIKCTIALLGLTPVEVEGIISNIGVSKFAVTLNNTDFTLLDAYANGFILYCKDTHSSDILTDLTVETTGVRYIKISQELVDTISGDYNPTENKWLNLTINGVTRGLASGGSADGAIRYDIDQTGILTDANINQAWANLSLGCKKEEAPATLPVVLNQTGLSITFADKVFKYEGGVTVDVSGIEVGTTCSCTITLQDSTVGPITGTVTTLDGNRFSLDVGTSDIYRISASPEQFTVYSTGTTYSGKVLTALKIESNGKPYTKIKTEIRDTVSGTDDITGNTWEKITINGATRGFLSLPAAPAGNGKYRLLCSVLNNVPTFSWTREKLDGTLTFTALAANSTVSLQSTGTMTLGQNFQYSVDDGETWLDYAVTNANLTANSEDSNDTPNATIITLANIGDKVSFKGNNQTGVSLDNFNYYSFVCTGSISISGDIMSLVDDGLCLTTVIPNNYCFFKLFAGLTAIVDVSELKLSALTLTASCYTHMFYSCTNLINAPVLPATILAGNCYNEMFCNCTALAEAPALPAETLAYGCYWNMFNGCEALTTAPELKAMNLEDYCYAGMFSGCEALTTAPVLNAMIMKEACYLGMFSSCKALTTAPALPATTLAKECYASMFSVCYALTKVPELPATTLAEACYRSMFQYSSALYVSDTPDIGYYTKWTIPTEGTFDNTSEQRAMFMGCAGTRAGGYHLIATAGELRTYYTNGGEYPGLTFTAKEDGVTIAMNKFGDAGATFQYYTNGAWQDFTPGSTVINLSNGEKVYFRGDNPNGLNVSSSDYVNFNISGNVSASGNIMSLLDNGRCMTTVIPEYYCFYALFQGCTGLTTTPELPATTLNSRCYAYMFNGCTGLTTAPVLPAETLKRGCYEGMFCGCTGLTTAPVLPATVATLECYLGMFKDCTSLTVMPTLPAETIEENCYSAMFEGCTALTTVSALPAKVLKEYCYISMFEGCTSLVNSPTLEATTLATGCYLSMFKGCTALITPPTLSIETLADNCYCEMFDGCILLATAPALPALIVNKQCYEAMFRNCLALTVAPALPATTLSIECYSNMFNGCTSLVAAPDLPATALSPMCYNQMFKGCTALVTAPELPATSANYSYNGMFNGCTSLIVSDDYGIGYYRPWRFPTENTFVNDISASDIFKNCKIGSGRSADTLTVNAGSYKLYYTNGGNPPSLVFTANTAGSTVAINVTGSPTAREIKYSTDNQATWQDYSFASDNLGATVITLANVGDKVYFKGNNPTGFSESGTKYYSFNLTGSIAASGNIMSLIDSTCATTTIPNDYCFNRLFANCVALTTPPELPATTLTTGCYSRMFIGCESLTVAPKLSALTIPVYGYLLMFSGCKALASTPELPATELNSYCYYYMFNGCTSLTTMPVLNTDFLAVGCYQGMFYGCTSLTTLSALPATELAVDCYKEMFYGCSSLEMVPELPARQLPASCYAKMFMGCTSLIVSDDYSAGYYKEWRIPTENNLSVSKEQQNMFTDCLGVRSSDNLNINVGENKIYYVNGGKPPVLTFTSKANGSTVALNLTGTITPARDFKYSTDMGDTWQDYTIGTTLTLANVGDTVSFKGMNIGGISQSEENYYSFAFDGNVSAEGDIISLIDNGVCNTFNIPCDYCFCRLFWELTKLTDVSKLRLRATTLSNNCYTRMFAGCTALTSVPALPATVLKTGCYGFMFLGCMALITPPELKATTLANDCYEAMFEGCTSLVTPPALPAETLADGCYQSMFDGCNKLETAPELPATTLVSSCYSEMFNSCSALTTAPALNAQTLGNFCYQGMFKDCTSLTSAPILPAMNLTNWCYADMFNGCTSLVNAPDLPALTLAENCYENMFNGCTSLWASKTYGDGHYKEWRIPTTLTFSNNLQLNDMFNGCLGTRDTNNLVPVIGEAITYYTNGSELFFTAKVENSTVELTANSTPTVERKFQYSTDKVNWTTFTPSTTTGTNVITLQNIGDKVYFRGNDLTGFSENLSSYYSFRLSGNLSVSGNPLCLMDNGTGTLTTIPCNCCFYSLFWGLTALTDISKFVLIATTMKDSCYRNMFNGCTGLTSAIELPATTLATSCYNNMFYGCKNLTSAPNLPATILYEYCYLSMFSGCTSLVDTPSISATTLADCCCSTMFKGCTSLVSVSPLFATTMAPSCYSSMFSGCTSISSTMSLNSTKLADSCYFKMFNGCTNLQSITRLPATTLANSCYKGMFSGCTKISALPLLKANTLTTDCYTDMFNGCTSLYVSDTPSTGYNQEWYIPSSGTFTNDIVLTNMFANCLGKRSTNNLVPTIGNKKTYYIPGNLVLTFTANAANSTVAMKTVGTPTARSFEYSTDNVNWNTFTVGITTITLANIGDQVLFRGNNTTGISESASKYYVFQLTGDLSVSGNIISLIDNGTCTTTALPNTFCFFKLFDAQTALSDASGLVLDATQTTNCYKGMFKSCSNLVTPPALPVTTVADGAYVSMFLQCTKLATAPALPATNIGFEAYNSLLLGCTSLTTPPALPATTLTKNCYAYMFRGCSNLTSAPALPATTLMEGCYIQMFEYCTSLTTPPALPATTLATNCYKAMFNGCTNINIAESEEVFIPDEFRIPSVGNFDNALTQTNMFQGCGGTRTSNDLTPTAGSFVTYYTGHRDTYPGLQFTNIDSAEGKLALLKYGTPTLGQSFELATTSNLKWSPCSYGTLISMPVGEVLYVRGNNPNGVSESASCYFYFYRIALKTKVSGNIMSLIDNGKCTTTTIPNDYCFYNLFKNDNVSDCSELTLPATTLKPYCYCLMFNSSLMINCPRELPADTVPDSAYQEMFNKCTSLTYVPTFRGKKLLTDACKSMFNGCTSLIVGDSTGSGGSVAWRLPKVGSFSNNGTQTGMFTSCKGTRSSDDLTHSLGSYKLYYTLNTQ